MTIGSNWPSVWATARVEQYESDHAPGPRSEQHPRALIRGAIGATWWRRTTVRTRRHCSRCHGDVEPREIAWIEEKGGGRLCASCFRDLGSAVDWKLTDKPREGQS